MYDVIIIGAGPAGLTAAIYTGRANLKTLVLGGQVMGGNAALTDKIANYPGFPEEIEGLELMERFQKQAVNFGAEIKMEEVLHIEDLGNTKKVVSEAGEYTCRAVILAMGARRKELGVPGEKEFLGRGVSYCATCDGAFFAGVPVAIIGGGDSAVKEALYMADIASKVYVITLMPYFTANKTDLDKVLQHEKIQTMVNREVVAINGEEMVASITLRDTTTGKEEILPVEGVFISIGLTPASELVRDLVKTEAGYVITDEDMHTSVKGIFAAGDIRSKKWRQVANAVGDGAVAGIAVAEYLKE
ncbi:thioredoxin reductase (NADPH) [Thermosyntropha lipolytica DSM 11003]|uniref:Thioredoxin reductase n=1 Tax=Thermosyntropha lipolytica DSM 11003 TaxID=1123382 RepID=A0A1M5R4R3_9FIRM|nr:thioredoxin-disulfide reductase [Thermosyntropha lipolytica]SHH21385.1 thioredoxin reductase (NADPH) [Thermosyntropha lipolytica DSM 11003]